MKVIIAKSPKWGDQETIVDDEDFDYLVKFNWSIRRCKNGKMYVRRNDYKNKQPNYIDMHRVIMGFPKGKQVDHIDNNPLNNQKNNLRICTQRQNTKNMSLSVLSKTGYKGVSFDKSAGRYSCFITCDYKHIFGGYFDDPIMAAKKYNELAVKHHGEFAKLNIIK